MEVVLEKIQRGCCHCGGRINILVGPNTIQGNQWNFYDDEADYIMCHNMADGISRAPKGRGYNSSPDHDMNILGQAMYAADN